MAADVAPAPIPIAGNVISIVLQMVTFGVLAICITRRVQNIGNWKKLPLATWLILIIYIDSTLFVFVTAIITRGFGINNSRGICEGGILLCLICYMTTKVFIYYFLVERAYIVRGSRQPRHKTKLWLFNCLGMLLPYVIVVGLNFVFRIAYIRDDGTCIIGMEKKAMLPLISFDVVVNVYLTLLFIIPLRNLYSYQHNKNTSLRVMTFRSFVGSIATLLSSVVNLTVLMVLKGEPGWICLMCCNADILFSVLVLHWVTQIDRPLTGSNCSHLSQHIENNDNKRNTLSDQRNTMDNGDKELPAVIQSRRESLSFDNVWPSGRRISQPTKNLVLAGTITTECKGARKERGGAEGRESEDNIVELDKIHVQTEHSQEVEIDGGIDGGSMSDSFAAETSVSAEKMV